MLQGWLDYPTFCKQMCDLATAQKVHRNAMNSLGGGMIQMRKRR